MKDPYINIGKFTEEKGISGKAMYADHLKVKNSTKPNTDWEDYVPYPKVPKNTSKPKGNAWPGLVFLACFIGGIAWFITQVS